MDFNIRKATLEDYEALCRIYAESDALHSGAIPQVFRKADGSARPREYIAEIISDRNSALFIAEHRGKVIGFVRAAIRASPDIPVMVSRQYVYVDDIAVTSEFQGKGAGRALMKKVQMWAKRKKASQIELNVWDFNENAIAFYKNLGYTMAFHRMWKTVG